MNHNAIVNAVQSSEAEIVHVPGFSEAAVVARRADATLQFVVTAPAVPEFAPIGLV